MPSRPTIAYQPALDGVRALAVIAVLLFHGEVAGFGGGYLGVSVFFTLSGFLITSLLVREHDATGRIDLGRFYSRRLRRLLPASALCLLAVVAIAAFTDLFDGVASLRDDVLGCVFQVANWVFLAGDGSYQDLLARTSGTASPLEHFWSLAIEEQFYWIWPPIITLLFARTAVRRVRLAWVGGLTVASLVAAPVVARVWGPDAAYWSTPARIGEILVGAMIAVVLAERSVPARWHVLAPVALVLLGGAVVLFPASGGPAYQGALPLVALVSGALLLGLQVDGPLRRVLSVGPLVALGRISYGVYLYHWPVFVLLDADRTGLDGPVLLAVRLAVTLTVSVASFRLLELPIRHATRVAPRLTFGASAVATATVVLAAIVLVPAGLGQYWETDQATAEAAAIRVDDRPLVPVPTTTPAPGTVVVTVAPTATDVPASDAPDSIPVTAPVETGPPPPATLPELARPVRIMVIGDSTANAFGSGVVAWAAANPDLAQAEIVPAPGCGFVTGGERRTGDTIEAIEGCDGWVQEFVLPEVERLRPDVVMAMVTSWDIVDRRWDGGELLTPLDPEYAERIYDDYSTLVAALLADDAATVALVRHPRPDPLWLDTVDAQEDPARHQVVYDVYDRIAAERPDLVRVIPLDRWLAAQGLDTDRDVRPDGIHVTLDAATQIASDYLGDQLIRISLGLPT
jgi:peptidoglycan/LPS O-acetylase OafA/YrhL